MNRPWELSLLIPLHCPWNVNSSHHSHPRIHFKDTALKEEAVVETIWMVYLTESS